MTTQIYVNMYNTQKYADIYLYILFMPYFCQVALSNMMCCIFVSIEMSTIVLALAIEITRLVLYIYIYNIYIYTHIYIYINIYIYL
jgi:hypothetical protein